MGLHREFAACIRGPWAQLRTAETIAVPSSRTRQTSNGTRNYLYYASAAASSRGNGQRHTQQQAQRQ
eukprot:6189998-Pleurochrysis_carterae.AAC.1